MKPGRLSYNPKNVSHNVATFITSLFSPIFGYVILELNFGSNDTSRCELNQHKLSNETGN